MKDLKHEIIEFKLDELSSRIEKIDESLKAKTDNNDVTVIIDEMVKDKQLITKTDLDHLSEKVEASIKGSQVTMIKWFVGTTISAIAAISGVISIF